MVADGAQACGILPVKLTDGINILCTAGHKGLYGITGTGMLITDGKFPLLPLMQGGTGSLSSQPEQPDFLPDALESGTLNVIGAASVKAGIEFVQKKGIQHLFRMESALCELLKTRLSAVPEVIVYRSPHAEYVPILSFSIRGMSSEETAARLAEQGFCLRAGMHCAPLAHHALGTQDGAVRFAPSAFSRMQDVQRLAEAVRVIASEKSKK
jgi:selenocysteine lyase/cysteine desulfurase